ncbi:PTS fructose transporter subunit IIB [Vibrio gallicus]|uniref:PTS fructose transporter subunit IIB n=1 Tax=Vibrio gallicus TaxID=190897 RepID=UPI0021C42324|nr:PTS fructose transporter subunit IIB [Vibrio gallicus]
MKVVAVTACPTGIAHTYMAADALKKAASKHNITLKVETQGAMGIENTLNSHDISQADKILIVSDIEIDQAARFEGCNWVRIPIEEVLLNVDKVLATHCRK